jgi:type II secretory pathway component PulF
MIFEDLNETLPLSTLILLGISGFFAKFWWLILSFLGLVVFYLKRLQATSQGKLWLDNVKLKIPVFGNYVRDVQIGRFARILGTLLDSGVVIVTALSSVCLVIDNDVLRHEIQMISQKVSGGSSLAAVLKESSLFPEAVVSMVAVGEQTGQVHRGLYKLAAYYEGQSQRFVKRVTSLIEPVLILIVGSIVLFIVMSLLMPIFRMNLIIQ